jgi:hypothetical protein
MSWSMKWKLSRAGVSAHLEPSCRYSEPQFRSGARQHSSAGDAGIESHPKRDLAHAESTDARSGLAFLPATDFGGEAHPPDQWIECEPSAHVFFAPIEFHFKISKCLFTTIADT